MVKTKFVPWPPIQQLSTIVIGLANSIPRFFAHEVLGQVQQAMQQVIRNKQHRRTMDDPTETASETKTIVNIWI